MNNINSLQPIKDKIVEDANLDGDRNDETEKSLFDNNYELKEDCDQQSETFQTWLLGPKRK